MLQAEAIEREVLSLRGEIVGAEEREATMLAQYVNVSFTLWFEVLLLFFIVVESNWACMECIRVCLCTLKYCIEGCCP